MTDDAEKERRGSIMEFLADLALDDDEDEDVVRAADTAQEKKSGGRLSVSGMARRLSFSRRSSKANIPAAGATSSADNDDGPRSEAAYWDQQQKKGMRLSRMSSAQKQQQQGGSSGQLSSRGGLRNSRAGGGGGGQLSSRKMTSGAEDELAGASAGSVGGFNFGATDSSLHDRPAYGGPVSRESRGRRSFGFADGEEPSAWMKVDPNPRKILSEVSRGRTQKTRI